jgi:hypothetical protein
LVTQPIAGDYTDGAIPTNISVQFFMYLLADLTAHGQFQSKHEQNYTRSKDKEGN